MKYLGTGYGAFDSKAVNDYEADYVKLVGQTGHWMIRGHDKERSLYWIWNGQNDCIKSVRDIYWPKTGVSSVPIQDARMNYVKQTFIVEKDDEIVSYNQPSN